MSDPADIPADYNAESIKVLRGFDAVRKRPGAFIGDTNDGSGLHNMVRNVVEHAIFEVLTEKAPELAVELHPDGSCTVRDNRRGLRIDTHEGVSAAEAILARPGDRKFNEAPPHWMFGNFESFGVAIVNALSTWLKLTIWRDGKEHFIEFRGGDTVAPLKEVGEARDKRGNEVSFLLSPEFFSKTEFDFTTLEQALRRLAIRDLGLKIVLSDRRDAVEKREEMLYDGAQVRPLFPGFRP